jgi:gamma-glutamylcyclotransferase (GGCT)/AIG2-like uncharacterized protein YtfP
MGYETRYDIRCFDLDWFLGAKCWPSEQGVVCEVYAVNERTLRNLDSLEGYRPHQPDRSTYVRKALNTRFGEAWLYEYQGKVDNCSKVQDYVAYRDRLDAKSDKAIDVGHLGLYFYIYVSYDDRKMCIQRYKI